jgi:hypothetical protein
LHVRHFLRHQFQLVGRLVAGDQFAVAIEDQAARAGDRLDTHAVALRQIRVVVMPHHLQHEQARDQADGGEPHQGCADE